MTDITSSAPGSTGGHGLRDIAARIRRRLGSLSFVSGYRAYTVYTRLSALSDRELADLGIERGDIARIAVSKI